MSGRSLAIAVYVAGLAACATGIQIDTSYNRAARFDSYHSFAWNQSQDVYAGTFDPNIRDRVEAIVRSTVAQDLVAKGFEQVPKDRADLLVSYSIVVTDQVQTNEPQTNRSVLVVETGSDYDGQAKLIRPGQGEGQLDRTQTYRQGTLILFITDRQQKKVVWQGTAEGTAITPREALAKSEKAVKSVMALFPPSQ